MIAIFWRKAGEKQEKVSSKRRKKFCFHKRQKNSYFTAESYSINQVRLDIALEVLWYRNGIVPHLQGKPSVMWCLSFTQINLQRVSLMLAIDSEFIMCNKMVGRLVFNQIRHWNRWVPLELNRRARLVVDYWCSFLTRFRKTLRGFAKFYWVLILVFPAEITSLDGEWRSHLSLSDRFFLSELLR